MAPGRIDDQIRAELLARRGPDADGPDAAPDSESADDSVVTVVLTEENGKTRLSVTARYPSRELRDIVLGSGMERGAALSYDRLEDVVARLKSQA